MSDETRDDSTPAAPPEHTPLTPIEYAAIHLCVPCGTSWIDEMVEQARRERLAGQVAARMYARPHLNFTPKLMADFAYAQADAMLAHSAKGGE